MPAPDQPGGVRSISIAENNSGIANTGDHAVIVLFNGGVSAECALVELTNRLVREVRAGHRPVGEELAEKANLLADNIRGRLQHAVEQLRLQDRSSLPVHWRPASGRAHCSGEDTRNAPSGAAGVPLPGLAGRLDEITAESRWLMVLGREGSGKSVLALQFALTRLEARSQDRKGPVPVLFSLGSWNPDAAPLRHWLIRRLERDQPFLAEVGPSGRTWAAALIDAGYVLPILDGFDEIIADLRMRALTQFNSSILPLVVTSRRNEIEAVTAKSNVALSAAAIELADLSLDDSVTYLHEVTGTTPADDKDATVQTGWTYVLGELGRRPHTRASANLASVLATPLMATLARFAYESELPGRDPSDLLKTEKFGTQDALEKHLLDFFIRTAYERFLDNEPAEGEGGEDRRWDTERARHWLGYLATHLTKLGTPDIEWWRLGTAMKLRWVMLRVGVTVAITSGIVAGLVYGAESWLFYGPAYGLMAAGFTGLANGLGVGLVFGLMHGFVTKMKVGGPTFEPSLMEIRLHGWTENGTKTRLRENFRPRVMGGLAGGLLFGLLWALGSAVLAALLGFPWPVIGRFAGTLLAVGIGLGLVIGLIAALGAGFETVIPREKLVASSFLLDTNRATVLKQITAVGLVIGTGYGTMFGLMSNSALAGLGAGLVAGYMVALGVGTMTTWGRWVVLAQIWLPLAGRLPRDLDAFLQDSYARGVLRREGAVFQFRHARLQEHLGDAYKN